MYHSNKIDCRIKQELLISMKGEKMIYRATYNSDMKLVKRRALRLSKTLSITNSTLSLTTTQHNSIEAEPDKSIVKLFQTRDGAIKTEALNILKARYIHLIEPTINELKLEYEDISKKHILERGSFFIEQAAETYNYLSEQSFKTYVHFAIKKGYMSYLKVLEELKEKEIFSDNSDRALVKIAQMSTNERKQEMARELLFERYSYYTKFIIKQLKLHYHESEEEDLIHQGYLFISKAIIDYKYFLECTFKTFVYFVIKKGYLSYYYQKSKHRFNESPASSSYENSQTLCLSEIACTKEAEVDENEFNDIVDTIKTSLTESEYNCVIARYYGASYKDISKMFGYSIKQIDNKIQNIRKNKKSLFV